MTSTIVDANVLLDFIKEGSPWHEWSRRAIERCQDLGGLVLNPVIYAEASVPFKNRATFDRAVSPSRFSRESLPLDAAFLAGKVHLEYRKAGGARERTLPDFLIGAHAMTLGYRLLTRDARRYRTYFTGLDIIAPDTHP
jgi:predicted nucleic acid-binding protein